MPRRLKRTVFLVDPEDNDTVLTLVGDEAELSCRVDVEVPGRFDIGGLMLDESQCLFCQVDLVNHNAVVSTVRAVKKLPARVHTYLSARIRTVKTFRKRRDGLDFRQMPRRRFVGKCRHRAIELVDHVSVLPIWVEGKVPRSGPGLDLCKRRAIGDDRPLFNVQPVNHDLVDSKVGYEGKAVVRADVDRMCMGAFLALGIHAGTGVLGEARRFSESSVRFDRNNRGVPTTVIGHKQISSHMVDADVTRTCTARWPLVEEPEVSRIFVDRIRTDTPGSAGLTNGIQELPVGMDL